MNGRDSDLAAALTAAGVVSELAPVLTRAIELDPGSIVRIRIVADRAAVFVRLPFGVLVARTVAVEGSHAAIDATIAAADLLAWQAGGRSELPAPRASDWRSSLPPTEGWRRIDTIPEDVIRSLVRRGATALKEVAKQDAAAGAQPRPAVTDAILGSVVLTVTAEHQPTVEVPLRALTALTRMGFLARSSHVGVDLAGRWVRLAAAYGSVFTERPGSRLTVLRT